MTGKFKDASGALSLWSDARGALEADASSDAAHSPALSATEGWEQPWAELCSFLACCRDTGDCPAHERGLGAGQGWGISNNGAMRQDD